MGTSLISSLRATFWSTSFGD